MKHLILCLALVASPAMAEDQEPSLFERGLRDMLNGLVEDIEPSIKELDRLRNELGPAIDNFMSEMGPELQGLIDKVGDWSYYELPEMLPNGDIIIRRKTEAPKPKDGIDI